MQKRNPPPSIKVYQMRCYLSQWIPDANPKTNAGNLAFRMINFVKNKKKENIELIIIFKLV